MTLDRLSHVVRQQLALGRLLPLGGRRDGAWLAESAARDALRRSVDGLPGVRLGTLRVGPAAGAAAEPSVPLPPSALPPGPLRIEARFAATAGEPIPAAAGRLRAALLSAARDGLGLAVDEVDLHVTDVLDGTPAAGASGDRNDAGGGGADGTDASARVGLDDREQAQDLDLEGKQERERERSPGREREAARSEGAAGSDESRVADAVRAVPGVARLGGRLGGPGRAVHIEESRPDRDRGGAGAALPARQVRVEVAVCGDRRPHEVACEVRRAASGALPDRPVVAVVITELTGGPGLGRPGPGRGGGT